MHIEHEIKQKFNTMLILDPHFRLFIQKEKKKKGSWSLQFFFKENWQAALKTCFEAKLLVLPWF